MTVDTVYVGGPPESDGVDRPAGDDLAAPRDRGRSTLWVLLFLLIAAVILVGFLGLGDASAAGGCGGG